MTWETTADGINVVPLPRQAPTYHFCTYNRSQHMVMSQAMTLAAAPIFFTRGQLHFQGGSGPLLALICRGGFSLIALSGEHGTDTFFFERS